MVGLSAIVARIAGWLKANAMMFFLGCAVFFLIMHIDLPGFPATAVERSLGEIVLALGLINLAYWLFFKKSLMPATEKRKVKGRRKR